MSRREEEEEISAEGNAFCRGPGDVVRLKKSRCPQALDEGQDERARSRRWPVDWSRGQRASEWRRSDCRLAFTSTSQRCRSRAGRKACDEADTRLSAVGRQTYLQLLQVSACPGGVAALRYGVVDEESVLAGRSLERRS